MFMPPCTCVLSPLTSACPSPLPSGSQDPASVYNLRGMLCRKERAFPKALRYLSTAIAAAPRIARLYYDRAQAYLDMALWPEVRGSATRGGAGRGGGSGLCHATA